MTKKTAREACSRAVSLSKINHSGPPAAGDQDATEGERAGDCRIDRGLGDRSNCCQHARRLAEGQVITTRSKRPVTGAGAEKASTDAIADRGNTGEVAGLNPGDRQELIGGEKRAR